MNLAMILLSVEFFEVIHLVRHMHVLFLALRSTTIRTDFEFTPALLNFNTHHTMSSHLRENWDMDSLKLPDQKMDSSIATTADRVTHQILVEQIT